MVVVDGGVPLERTLVASPLVIVFVVVDGVHTLGGLEPEPGSFGVLLSELDMLDEKMTMLC